VDTEKRRSPEPRWWIGRHSRPHLWKKAEKIGRGRKIASKHIESDLRYHCHCLPMSPSIYIIAGPNGVGKTTFAREFLPNYANCRNFINADLIAQGMAPFSPDVRRRFHRSIKNFLVLYRALADSWFLFDNPLRTPSVIALEEQGRLRIMKSDTYDTLVAQYGNSD